MHLKIKVKLYFLSTLGHSALSTWQEKKIRKISQAISHLGAQGEHEQALGIHCTLCHTLIFCLMIRLISSLGIT